MIKLPLKPQNTLESLPNDQNTNGTSKISKNTLNPLQMTIIPPKIARMAIIPPETSKMTKISTNLYNETKTLKSLK